MHKKTIATNLACIQTSILERQNDPIIPHLSILTGKGTLTPLTKMDFFSLTGAVYTNTLFLATDLYYGYYHEEVFRAERFPLRSFPRIPQLYIAFVSDEIGHGLFAAEDIPENTFVGNYSGYVCSPNERYVFYPYGRYYRYSDIRVDLHTDFEDDSKDDFMKNFNLCIDSEYFGNHARMINHAEEPNIKIKALRLPGHYYTQASIVTTRMIKTGEQLLDDYGEQYWKGHVLATQGKLAFSKHKPSTGRTTQYSRKENKYITF